MSFEDPRDHRYAVFEAARTLLLNQTELGKLLGVSLRTVLRWKRGGMRLDERQARVLAEALLAKDPAAAIAFASSFGETLESLGVEVPEAASPAQEEPPQRSSMATTDLADSVLCAAAESADLSPRLLRPALLAALARAARLGLTLEDLRLGLAGGEGSDR